MRMRTIDGYQGQEKPIVIYHIVKSNTDRGSVTVFGNANHLTTAITRCKDPFILFSDFDFLKSAANRGDVHSEYDKLSLFRNSLEDKEAVI